MSRQEREWHPNFILYMEKIINHPNYKGLCINRKQDGTPQWIATAKSEIGKARIAWCKNKAVELGFPIQPGVYADVMLEIHPTKRKTCQTCGKEMSIYYHYPNVKFLKSLNEHFNSNFSDCDHISSIWDTLLENGYSDIDIADFLISKGSLNITTTNKNEVIAALEVACRKGNKKSLGPGAMSNFPDRFDGFHTYNRCCRSSQDKGRSKDNLKSYTKDRRAYEYWSDGNIHAANQFMGSKYFKGISADHIGPISLGFVHDPRYLQPMPGSDNSAKRDRLQLVDIEKILATETRTHIYPMTWYSKHIWEYIKNNYANNIEKIGTKYRDALKQNMSNFMYILMTILITCGKSGEQFLIEAFLKKNYDYFNYSYQFSSTGDILIKEPRHHTARNINEIERYTRIAIESVYDYNDKENRNTTPNLIQTEIEYLQRICMDINNGVDFNTIKNKVLELVKSIEQRLISSM